jgi:two-component system chemotaxis sensor kinase CheA
MYIEDDELRDIYKTVTPERLQKLEGALMHLEKQPSDAATLEEFLREAHTLKGDSRMLGVNDVETLIHQMEDCMVAVKQGNSQITPELCDRLYHGLDAIRKLVKEAVTGEASGINTFLVLAQLMGAESKGSGNGNDSQQETAAAKPIVEETNPFDDLFASVVVEANVDSPPQESEANEQQPTTNRRRASDSLDTIRVDSEKLDALMRQAGELSITKLRVSRRLSEIEKNYQASRRLESRYLCQSRETQAIRKPVR